MDIKAEVMNDVFNIFLTFDINNSTCTWQVFFLHYFDMDYNKLKSNIPSLISTADSIPFLAIFVDELQFVVKRSRFVPGL